MSKISTDLMAAARLNDTGKESVLNGLAHIPAIVRGLVTAVVALDLRLDAIEEGRKSANGSHELPE